MENRRALLTPRTKRFARKKSSSLVRGAGSRVGLAASKTFVAFEVFHGPGRSEDPRDLRSAKSQVTGSAMPMSFPAKMRSRIACEAKLPNGGHR